MSEPRGKGTKAVAVVLSGVGVAIILCIGGVVAIAAPKFMRFQDRSWQSECKSNLRSIATAERAFYEEHARFSPKYAEVGFLPEKGNRYQYRLGPGALGDEAFPVDTTRSPDAVPALLDAALPPALQAKLGVKGTCPECELTASCAGNLDSDDVLDVWSITVGFQKDGEGYSSVSGQLTQHVDDAAR
ncbi:MAG: pilin [Archangium sp.]|nr:pilin [Archangium sp.]